MAWRGDFLLKVVGSSLVPRGFSLDPTRGVVLVLVTVGIAEAVSVRLNVISELSEAVELLLTNLKQKDNG